MAVEFYVDDCKQLLLQIKEEEKLLRLKRRWLMDLPLSTKLMKTINPLADKTIPEMLLREDDVYYDAVKSSVQSSMGNSKSLKDKQDKESMRSFDSKYILKNMPFLLDKMTDKGLHCFVKLLRNSSVEVETRRKFKYRRKMKKVIKEQLPVFLNEKTSNFQERLKQISHLLEDPGFFKGDHAILGSPTEYQTAAERVLDRLEDLPVLTLIAMRRKLSGESRDLLEFGSCTRPWKSFIIGAVRKTCMTMLSELHEGEELPEVLVKTLAVAGLTLKLILGVPSVPEFQKVPPQIQSLQHDIAAAVCLINSRSEVSPCEIEEIYKTLPHWDGSEKLSPKTLRVMVRNILMDFLFECNDMEHIPESLLAVVSDIKNRSPDSGHRNTFKDEEEAELLLGFSAQTKQIVWDLVPGLEVDQDFANSYMGDMGVSDDDEGVDDKGMHLPQNHELGCDDSKSLSESSGETNPVDSGLPTSRGIHDGISLVHSLGSQLNHKLQSMNITERDTFEPHDLQGSTCFKPELFDGAHSPESSLRRLRSLRMHKQTDWKSSSSTTSQGVSPVSVPPGRIKAADVSHSRSPTRGMSNMHDNERSAGNKYLCIQKACDDTTMAMYNIIGGMLDRFAKERSLNLSRDDSAYLQSHA